MAIRPPSPWWLVPPFLVIVLLIVMLAYISFFLGESYSQAYREVLVILSAIMGVLGIASEIMASQYDKWRFFGATIVGAGGCGVSYIFSTLGLSTLSYLSGLLASSFFLIVFAYLWAKSRIQSTSGESKSQQGAIGVLLWKILGS